MIDIWNADMIIMYQHSVDLNTLCAFVTYRSIEYDYHLQHSLCWLVQISVD